MRHVSLRNRQGGWAAIPALWQAGVAAIGAKVVDSATKSKTPALPTPPIIPNQDVAAQAAMGETDMLRKRRGVMSNIFAGGNAAAPQVASKSTLGT